MVPALGDEGLICTVKTIVIEHSFEIATFVFFVGPMVLITALYCLIGFALYNSTHLNDSRIRLRKTISGQRREQGQQRVLKMLGKLYFSKEKLPFLPSLLVRK